MIDQSSPLFDAAAESAPCVCGPVHESAGTYAPDCLKHEPWRCVLCEWPLVEGPYCVTCARRWWA